MFERFFKKKEEPVPEENRAAESERPAPEGDLALARLRESIGWIPEELLALYRNPEVPDDDSPARLMSIEEVLRTNADLASAGYVQTGPICWFWTDDNSNYCGVYMDGPLTGWLTRLDHDEPVLAPAYRSVNGFLARLDDPGDACDIPMLAAELPCVEPGAINAESDAQLAAHFKELYNAEQDEDRKRHFAYCSICLTPVERTGGVLTFLESADMWIPEAAIRLMEVRRYEGAIIER